MIRQKVKKSIFSNVSQNLKKDIHNWLFLGKQAKLSSLSSFVIMKKHHLSCVAKKSTFCKSENRDAEQLCSNRGADQRLCFHYCRTVIVQYLYFLNISKYRMSGLKTKSNKKKNIKIVLQIESCVSYNNDSRFVFIVCWLKNIYLMLIPFLLQQDPATKQHPLSSSQSDPANKICGSWRLQHDQD